MSLSTAPSSANLPPIAGDKGNGVTAYGWVYDDRGFFYSAFVAFIYTAGDQDLHYSVDVVVGADEIDVLGRADTARIVAQRSADAIKTLLGVRRAVRRKLGISRHPAAV